MMMVVDEYDGELKSMKMIIITKIMTMAEYNGELIDDDHCYKNYYDGN